MAHETPLREEHERHGATLGVWFGALMPERFSDFTQEYGFARETVALADKNYRTFFELTGPDRQRYLNAIVTNDIKSLTPGQGAITLLLNPQGHIKAELEVYALEDRLQVVSYAMIREQLFAELDKFIIMDDVTLTDVTDQLAALSLEGPRTTDIVWAICGVDLSALAELSHLEVKVSSIPCRIVRRSPGGIPGAEFMVARGRMLALWQALKAVSVVHGGGPIGYAALRAVSLEDGVPWFGYDFDEQVIPHEAALENIHISYTKGCYTGQEIVERVRSRGQVNRKRVGLEFSGSEIPATGTKLSYQGKEVGQVTGAAFSPALGHPIGMGYVRREANTVGTELEWPGGTAKVIELPVR